MNTPAPHLSSLALDALALGALPPDERTHAEDHLAHCPACRARAQTQEEARAHFSARVLPATLPSLRTRALPWWRRRGAWMPALGLALAATAALLLVVRTPGQTAATRPEEDLYRVKGGASLGVYAHRGERVWKVAQGEALAPGDQVRFRVQPGGLPYLLLVSVDGAGQVSVYHPFGGRRSARVAQAADSLALPGSVVLDAAPGPERIYALFSEAPLDVDAVSPMLESLARGGAPAIRASTQLQVPAEAQASFLFEKSRP